MAEQIRLFTLMHTRSFFRGYRTYQKSRNKLQGNGGHSAIMDHIEFL